MSIAGTLCSCKLQFGDVGHRHSWRQLVKAEPFSRSLLCTIKDITTGLTVWSIVLNQNGMMMNQITRAYAIQRKDTPHIGHAQPPENAK